MEKGILELVVALQQEINRLKGEVAMLKNQILRQNPVSVPFTQALDSFPHKCPDGTFCEYPSPWHATIPPNCKKCGKQGKQYKITCATNSSTYTDILILSHYLN